MDATRDSHTRARRRLAATLLSLTTAGVLAGGTGGYLIHGATALGTTAPHAVGPVVSGRGLNDDAASGYRASAGRAAALVGLNGDSSSGYAAVRSDRAPSHALNADSGSGY